MGGREAGSHHESPLGNRVTLGHRASTYVGPLRRGSGNCMVVRVSVALHCYCTEAWLCRPAGPQAVRPAPEGAHSDPQTLI
jgi:hypothetical protein